MAKVEPALFRFNGGEVSELLDAATDLKKYYSACLICENFIPLLEGGATSRPGLYYVAEVKDSSKKVRLMSFQRSTIQGYIVEMGDYYARFFKEGAQIVSAPSTPYELTTLYPEADLLELKSVQSADTMYIAHKSYAPSKLTSAGHTSWSVSTITFTPPPTAVVDHYPNKTLTLAAVTGANILCTASGSVFLAGDVNRVIKSGAGRGTITTFVSGTQVRIDITTDFAAVGPIAANSWAIYGSFSSSLTPSIKEPVNAIVTLTSSGSTETRSSLVDSSLKWTAAGHGTDTYYCQLAAGGDPSITSPSKCYENDVEMVNGAIATLGLSQWAYGDHDTLGFSTVYVRLSDGTDPDTKADAYVEAAYTVVAADLFRSTDIGNYVRVNGGFIKILSVTSATVARGQILKLLDGVTASTDWSLEGSVWSSTLGYPGAVGFFEQRLAWAGSTIYPQTIWLSTTEDYENHNEDPVEADAAVTYRLTNGSGKVDAINWIMGENVLILGTTGGITKFGATSQTDPLAQDNISAKLQKAIGVKDIDAEMVDDAVVFVQRGGTTLRRIQYDFSTDKYQAADLTRLAKHICKGSTKALSGIVDMDFQSEPFPILWAVRADGVLLGMLYVPSEDMVVPWFRLVTDGEFESVAVESREGDEDRVWVAVKRTINGTTKRYIEYFMPFENYGSLANAFCVDSGLTLTCTGATTSVTGLTHLANKTVRVVTNKGTHPDCIVSEAGVVTLAYALAEDDWVTVGLPYTCDIMPMKIEVPTQAGSSRNKMARIVSLAVSFYRTYGAQWGPNEDELQPVPFSAGEVPTLHTETMTTDFAMDHARGPTILLRQSLPYPMTVLAMYPEVIVNG